MHVLHHSCVNRPFWLLEVFADAYQPCLQTTERLFDGCAAGFEENRHLAGDLRIRGGDTGGQARGLVSEGPIEHIKRKKRYNEPQGWHGAARPCLSLVGLGSTLWREDGNRCHPPFPQCLAGCKQNSNHYSPWHEVVHPRQFLPYPG